jgi:hypothetical protein
MTMGAPVTFGAGALPDPELLALLELVPLLPQAAVTAASADTSKAVSVPRRFIFRLLSGIGLR